MRWSRSLEVRREENITFPSPLTTKFAVLFWHSLDEQRISCRTTFTGIFKYLFYSWKSLKLFEWNIFLNRRSSPPPPKNSAFWVYLAMTSMLLLAIWVGIGEECATKVISFRNCSYTALGVFLKLSFQNSISIEINIILNNNGSDPTRCFLT